MSNQPQSVEGTKELKNKLVKFYWSNSLEQNGKINLDLVDGSGDFSLIPSINKRVDIEVGELRDIISYVVDYFQGLLTHQQSEVLETKKEIEIGEKDNQGKDEAWCNWYECPSCKDTRKY